MKITVYELLGLVKDGKAPKKIKYVNSIWKYNNEVKDYIHDDLFLFYGMNAIGLTERYVEILEEQKKIPEKMDRELNCDDDSVRGLVASVNEIYKEIADKYNEIIDYLKSKGE